MVAARLERCRGLGVHCAVFAALAWWSWGKWSDPIVDFGRELYVPWQLSQGRILYRDVASLFGPFSSYFNAAWFSLFGPSLLLLAVINLALLALLTWAIHVFVERCCDRFTASAVSLTVLLLFGFSQYAAVGNFNYVTPYAHEMTHSVMLAVASLIAAFAGLRRRSLPWCGAAGVLYGLVFLTKPEAMLALTVGVIAAVAAFRAAGLTMPRWGGRLFAAGAVLPAGIAFAFFVRHMPAHDAWRATIGAWDPLLTTTAAQGRFYAHWIGIDDPIWNAIVMLKYFVGFGVFCATAAATDALAIHERSRSAAIAWRLFRALLLVSSVFVVRWHVVPQAFPLILICLLAALGWMLGREPRGSDDSVKLAALFAWTAFAFVLMAKMFLNARLYHYGAYLGLPAAVSVLVGVLWLIPRELRRNGHDGTVFRTLAAIMLMAAIGTSLIAAREIYRLKDYPAADGADRFLAFSAAKRWEGPVVRQAVEYLRSMTPPGATVVTIPEGVMINYLARRTNPSRYIVFMPPELNAFGARRMLDALRQARPDYVVVVARDMSEYGVPPLAGDDVFGRPCLDWIASSYQLDATFGRGSVADGGEAIEIWRRRY